MNTRGLTELIVLNIALEKGVISAALFTSLVIMALVTTLMAGPLLRLHRSQEPNTGRLSAKSSTAAKRASEARTANLATPIARSCSRRDPRRG